MGNEFHKDTKEFRKVRSQHLASKFHRIKTVVDDYNPMQNDIEWEEIYIDAFQGEITVYISSQIEKSVEINKDFKLLADDPINNELLVEHQSEVWRLRAESLHDFIQWKHLLTLCRRPEPTYSDHCQIDKVKFTQFNKSVWCRNCGLVVCKNCSREKALLKSLGYHTAQRICNLCSQQIQEGKDGTVESMISKHKLMSNSLMRASGINKVKSKRH